MTGTAPDATVDLCVAVARERGKSVRVDLLGTSPERQRELLRHRDAIFGIHVSKDVQESGGTGPARMASRLPDWVASYHMTAAGGITLADIPALGDRAPRLTVIVGSAITGAAHSASSRSTPRAASRWRTRATISTRARWRWVSAAHW